MLRRRALYKKSRESGFFGQGQGYVNFTSLPLYYEDFNLNFKLKFTFKVPVLANMSPINELLFGNSITSSKNSCFGVIRNSGIVAARFNYLTQLFEYSGTFNENEYLELEFKKIGSQMFVYKNGILNATLSTVANTGSIINSGNIRISAGDVTPVRPATAIFKDSVILETLDSGGAFQSSEISAPLNIKTGMLVPNSGNGSDGAVFKVGGLPADSWWVDA